MRGGAASPLASPAGQETFPKFSPDGERIAFVGNYDGNRDLYTIAISGGVPQRVTYHPARETFCDWTPGSDLLYYSNAFAGLRRQSQLLTISSTGGLPQKLPPPYGANGAISPDGKRLAYTPHSRDNRTWKRYRGGMATDIWLFDFDSNQSEKITDWEGTDSLPMWHGDIVYYLSDAGPEHRLNIWSYDTKSKRRKQTTKFSEYDVKWPSIGPGVSGDGEIVFQNGAGLYLLDLATAVSKRVSVSIPGDRPTIRPRSVNAADFLVGWNISPTGKRAVVEARGDVWTVPAKNGSPRNLTRTDGVAERFGAWSPDGQWIAYFSDQTGEYELYIAQSDGKGETKQLTRDGKIFRYAPTWSPDSKRLAFWDKSGVLSLHEIESGETKLLDTDTFSGQSSLSWSHDSRWLAYGKSGDNNMSSIYLFDADAGTTHQVTSGMFNDTWQTFDREGDYLFFATNRDFSSPTYEDVGQSFIYADTDVLVVVPLRDDVGSPWAPESDEETWKEDDDDEDDDDDDDDDDGDEDDDDDAKKKKDDKDAEKKPVKIELEGFERRALRIPVKRGSFAGLAVTHDGKLVYSRAPRRGSDDKPAIKILDLDSIKKEKSEKKREKTVVPGARAFRMSADGKKLLIRQGKKMSIVDAKADQKLDKSVSLAGMDVRVDPRSEWRQIFTDAWRVFRDFFYDPNMHGVDWDAMNKQYGAMLEDCMSRRDVAYVIGEMVSELNVGQRDKDALIIDERWNGGGQIPTRFIELLNRPVTNYWAVRNGKDWTWPPDSHQGPKCMLINGLAGSGGDAFPYYFRQSGLGKLIGMRTWGGLVGISGNPTLVDGGRISAPTFAFYETDGTWGIEGHGVDPDIKVIDDPALMVDGGDPQLDAASSTCCRN